MIPASSKLEAGIIKTNIFLFLILYRCFVIFVTLTTNNEWEYLMQTRAVGSNPSMVNTMYMLGTVVFGGLTIYGMMGNLSMGNTIASGISCLAFTVLYSPSNNKSSKTFQATVTKVDERVAIASQMNKNKSPGKSKDYLGTGLGTDEFSSSVLYKSGSQ